MKLTDKFVLLPIEHYERLKKREESNNSTENSEEENSLKENKKKPDIQNEIFKESEKKTDVQSKITEKKPEQIQKVSPPPPGVPVKRKKKINNKLKWVSLS